MQNSKFETHVFTEITILSIAVHITIIISLKYSATFVHFYYCRYSRPILFSDKQHVMMLIFRITEKYQMNFHFLQQRKIMFLTLLYAVVIVLYEYA